MRVLVVAAHPDDEVLGCGGTISKLAMEGHEIQIAILGEGATSRHPQDVDANEDAVTRLQSQSHLAASLLGAGTVTLHGLPDNRFDTLPLLDVVKIVEGLVQSWRPHQLLTHHGGDLNIDHAVVHRAVMTATRPVQEQLVSELLLFEIPSSTEWSFGQLWPPFQPNVFVDVSATIGKKLEAMQLYQAETRPYPHPRSSETLKAVAQRWGSASGFRFAEAFVLARSLRA